MSNELSTETTLTMLAERINMRDAQLEQCKGQAVVLAAKIGADLARAKEMLGHGNFEPWLEVNYKIQKTQIQNYMKLARGFPELLDDAKEHPGVLLAGIKQAIELLSAPDEVKEAVHARAESGEHVTVKEIQALKKQVSELETKRRVELGSKDAEINLLKNNPELSGLRQKVREAEEQIEAIKAGRDRIVAEKEKQLAFALEREKKLKAAPVTITVEPVDDEAESKLRIKTARLEIEHAEKMADFGYKEAIAQSQLDHNNKEIDKLRAEIRSMQNEASLEKLGNDCINEIKKAMETIAGSLHHFYDEQSESKQAMSEELVNRWCKVADTLRDGSNGLDIIVAGYRKRLG